MASKIKILGDSRSLCLRLLQTFIILLSSLSAFNVTGAPLLEVSGYELVNTVRIDRYQYQHTYKLQVINRGSQAFAVEAIPVSPPAEVTPNPASLSLGRINAGEIATSEEAFTYIHNRRNRFSTDALQWRFEFKDPELEPVLSIEAYELIQTKRVSRFVYEFTYHASLRNLGLPIESAAANLGQLPAGVTAVDSTLNFSVVNRGERVAANDTFVVRYERRRQKFSANDLMWEIEAVLPGFISEDVAIAKTQTLDALGHPLGQVQVETISPDVESAPAMFSDAESGAVNLTGEVGSYTWKFTKPEHLPVWRDGDATPANVSLVPSPWLAKRNPTLYPIGILGGGTVGRGDGEVTVNYLPGSVAQNTEATLTMLNGQSLPGFLPIGWSPLRSFWLELNQAPGTLGKVTFQLPELLQTGEIAGLVKWNEAARAWVALATIQGDGGNAYSATLPGEGAYSIVLPDSLPSAPPGIEIGQSIQPSGESFPGLESLSATGTVSPAVSGASLDEKKVTATATVIINADVAMPSGLKLRGEIDELYQLVNGDEIRLPRFSSSLVAYQQQGQIASQAGGDAFDRFDPTSLSAGFPLRPRLLFSSSTLSEASISAQILLPEAFSGGVLGPNGGRIVNADISVTAAPDVFDVHTPVELRLLNVDTFAGLASGLNIVSAFELLFSGLIDGQQLIAEFGRQEISSNFVLAKLVTRHGVVGLEPIARYASDENGVLSYLESLLSPQLHGITEAGRFVLLEVAAPQSVVAGQIFDSSTDDAVIVQVADTPWLTTVAADGSYKLIAGLGVTTVTVTDLSNGDRGSETVTVDANGATANLSTEDTGPRIVQTVPAADEAGVNTVSPVSVVFSETLSLENFNDASVIVKDAEDGVVSGQLSLNQTQTKISFLSDQPFANQTEYVVEISPGLTDENGRVLEGLNSFNFSTEASATRKSGAQLISYEPGSNTSECAGVPGYVAQTAGISCVVGTQGVADAEVPVIIINEASGETATVLSKADGSFKSFVNADVDDFISATFINANGTRISIPLSRQLFDNGQVALFQSGGILEAQNEEAGKVSVLVEPKAVPEKTKFDIEPLSLNQLLAFAKGAMPEEGQLIGGLKLTTEGDELVEPADIALDVEVSALDLAAGEAPEDRTFALVSPLEVDGETVYQIIDKAKYEDGKVITASPPFDGVTGAVGGGLIMAMVMMPAHAGARVVVTGKVISAPSNLIEAGISEAQILAGKVGNITLPRVAGALVSISPCCTSAAGLRSGAFVSVTNSRGAYATLVPANGFSGSQFVVVAQSVNFGINKAKKIISTPTILDGIPAIAADLVFEIPSSAGFDSLAPQLSFSTPASILPVGSPVEVSLNLRDNLTLPSINAVEFLGAGSVELLTGESLSAGSVSLQLGAENPTGIASITAPLEISSDVSAVVNLNVEFSDAAGNSSSRIITLRFGAAPQVSDSDLVASDPDDETGANVLNSSPANGVITLPRQVVIRFSEPISRAIETTPSAVTVTADSTGNQLQQSLSLSLDQTELTISLNELHADEQYAVVLNAGQIIDLAGNPMEESYLTTFRTPQSVAAQLSGVDNAVSSAVHAGYSYSIDRANSGQLVVHLAGETDNVTTLSSLGLPETPRQLLLIPDYSYRASIGGPVQRGPLLVATGGVLGGDAAGQWLWVIDIKDPLNPIRLSSEIAAVGPAASIGTLRFSAPYIALHTISPQGSTLQFVNLQAFILAESLGFGEFAETYVPGVDANGDGDFVDVGDELPVPEKRTLFGLESIIPIASGRVLNDFSTAVGTGFVVGTMPRLGTTPSRLQVLNFSGSFVGNGGNDDGGYILGGGDNAFRVTLLPSFKIKTDVGIKQIPVALVAVGAELHVVDLSNPIVPELTGKLTLPSEIGKIFSLSIQQQEIVVGTDAGIAFLNAGQIIELDQTVAADVVELLKFENTGRTFGANEATVTTVYGGRTRTIVRQPKIKVVTMPATPVQTASDIAALDDEAIAGLLGASVENRYILPAPFNVSQFECNGVVIEWLLDGTPNPAYHHYALITASGTLGETFKVAVESLGFGAELHHSLGKDYPPIMLSDATEQLNLDDAQPEANALTARRLSNDPTSELYNKYITSSFVALRSPITPEQMSDVRSVAERSVIWSGHYLRFSFDAGQMGNAELLPFNSQIDGINYRAATTKRYPSIPGEFIDNPNPSFRRAAPRHAGVDLQSGEYRHPEVDIRIAGRTQELLMARIYESRHRYIGPFGRGWDFNWNARIVQLPEDVPPDFSIINAELADGTCAKQGPGDVLLIDGAGKVLRFTPIKASNNNLDWLPAYQNDPAIGEFFGANTDVDQWTFYQSPEDEFSVLFKVSDGRWLVVAPNGARTWFHTDGRLERIINPFEESVMQVEYRPDGRIGRVIGDRGIGIEFGYYKKFFFDSSFGPADVASDSGPELGRIARIRSTHPLVNNAEVNYEYDVDGNLALIRPRDKPAQAVVYDSQKKHLIQSIGNGDSTTGFSQRIMYDPEGLVESTELMGQTYSFSGAVGSARERQAAGDSSVTVSGAANANFSIDNRGRPTMFSNRPIAADDAGRLTTFANEDSEYNVVYDDSNPIYRFRGNSLRSEEIIDGEVAFTTSREYDQSAFNRLEKLTDPNGVVTELDYPNGNKVASIGNGLVLTTTTLNDFGQIIRRRKQAGDSIIETNYTLSPAALSPDSGLVTSVDIGGAPVGSTTRDDAGRVDFFESAGVDYTITFDDEFDLPEITNGTGMPSVTHGYDDEGRLQSTAITAVDKAIVTQYSYDTTFPSKIFSLSHQETGMPAEVSSYFYDEFGRLERVNVNGEDTEYEYNGLRTTKVESPGTEKVYEFDGVFPSKITDKGLDIELTWDKGRIASTTNSGATTTLIYADGVKRPIGKTVVDADYGTLLEESFFYDAAGRLEQIIEQSGRQRTFTFFANGDIRSMALNGIVSQSSERDAAGRTIRATLADTQVDYGNFDVNGTPLTERLTLLGSGRVIETTFIRSNFGRTIKESIGGSSWTTSLDGFSNLASTIDPDGVTTAQNHSPSGHVLSSTFSDGSLVQYIYDQHWRVDSITAPGGTLDFTYANGLATGISYPDGSSINYSLFNDSFEPERAVMGDVEQTLSWKHGKIVEIATNKGDELTYKHDGLGHTREVGLNGFKVRYGFNDFGDSVSESTPLGSWELETDVRGQVFEETYPSGFTLTYSSDIYGRPIAIPEINVDTVSWLGSDTWENFKLSNGLCVAQEYDNRLRTSKILYGMVTGECSAANITANRIAGFEYDYTNGDRINWEYRVHEDRYDVYTRNSPSEGMRITNFALSALDVSGTSPVASVNGVSFDSFAEIRSASSAIGTDQRALNPTRQSTIHRLDEINGVPVVHDANGSITSILLWVFVPNSSQFEQVTANLVYDGLQMLSQVVRADGCTITYERDGLGRVHRRSVAGPAGRCVSETIRYAWKGKYLIEEYLEATNGDLSLIKRYAYLGGIPIRIESFINGVLQSFTPLVTVNGSIGGYIDSSGILAEQIVYGPYGLPVTGSDAGGGRLSAIGSTLMFHGAWFDEATGLYQMGQRNLHPVLGRFLQRDNDYFVENTAFYSAFNGDPVGRTDARGTYSNAVFGGGRRLSSFRARATRPAIFVLPSEQLNKAYALKQPGRSNSALAAGVVGAASRALHYAAMLSNEETKATLEEAKTDVDDLKTAISGFQTVATATSGLLKERDALRGIRSITRMASMNGMDTGAAGKLVAAGGFSGLDLGELDLKFIDHKGYRQARELANSGQRGALQSHSFGSSKKYFSYRKNALLKIGKGGSTLARLHINRQARGATSPNQIAAFKQSQRVLNVSDALLDVAGHAIARGGRTRLSNIKSALKGGSLKSTLFGRVMPIGAAFDLGMASGVLAISMVLDDQASKDYLAMADKFVEDGGFLTAISGLMSDPMGWDEGAYAIQRFHDDGLKVFAPPNFNLIGGKRAALDQQRLQNLDAP